MRRSRLKPWFVGINAIFIVLTAASYPNIEFSTAFFTASLVLFACFLTIWIALDPRRREATSVSEAPEPRDATTGRLD